MPQVTDLCEDSDDNGEWPNTAAVPSLPILYSRERPRDKDESTNDTYHRNESGSGNKTATGSVEFVVDPELADEVEVSVLPHSRKRRSVLKSKRGAKNGAAEKCAQILKGAYAIEHDVGSEDAQVADHRESDEGIAAAASRPMNSDSEQTSRDNGSTNKHSQKLTTSKPPSNASRRQCWASAWEDRLRELAGYLKIDGHCNVPRSYAGNSKLAIWVTHQRR
jgi:hypothetical protein